jgi:hypothetical protein
LLFRDDIEERGRETEDESGVVLIVNLPTGGGVSGNDVDVAVNCRAGVAHSCTAAGDFGGGAYVDRDEDTLQLGNFEDSDRVGPELQGQPLRRFAKGEDRRELLRVWCDT